jgi:alpha-tubulin suppressor-like RCC1 family protein
MINHQLKLIISKATLPKDIAINQFGLLIIDINDDIWFYDTKCSTMKEIKGIKGKSVAVGYNHAAIIDKDNNLWMFGNVRNGQLGFPLNLPKERHYKNLDDCKDYEQIIEELNGKYKLPTKLEGIKAKSVSVGDYNTMIIDVDNNVLMWGSILDTEIPILISNIKTKQISVGYNHVLILDYDGNVYGLGSNNMGQLGLGNLVQNANIPTPIPGCKARYICAGLANSVIIGFKNNILI